MVGGPFEQSEEGKRRIEQAEKRKTKESEERKETKRPTAAADSAASAGSADEAMEADRVPKRQVSGGVAEQPTAKVRSAPPSSGTRKREGDSQSSQVSAKARVQPERNKRSSGDAGLADRPPVADLSYMEICWGST
eukprot:3476601-Karenia_brevis.AAC.1